MKNCHNLLSLDIICLTLVFAFLFVTYFARKPNVEQIYIYLNNFFHNYHLSEASFTCPGLQASGLAWRLFYQTSSMYFTPLLLHIILNKTYLKYKPLDSLGYYLLSLAMGTIISTEALAGFVWWTKGIYHPI